MTEAEWLRCRGPHKMLALLRQRASDRKLRLFAVACYRQSRQGARRPRPVDEQLDAVLVKAEELADGSPAPDTQSEWLLLRDNAFGVATAAAKYLASIPGARSVPHRVQIILLRDIFGNPFRPVGIDPRWLTADVVALARGIYDERAFDRLPILADALQDAGCDHPDILSHCRGEGPHVRGCWVVDLLLGKS